MKKLREVLLVLLSSDQQGEVAAAAAVIRKELAKAGRDVHWLADQLAKIMEAPLVTKQTNVGVYTNRRAQTDWTTQLNDCVSKVIVLNDREAEFITSLYEQWTIKGIRWEPTAKQLRWLQAIHEKLQHGDPFGRW
jgi:hypothetical protein